MKRIVNLICTFDNFSGLCIDHMTSFAFLFFTQLQEHLLYTDFVIHDARDTSLNKDSAEELSFSSMSFIALNKLLLYQPDSDLTKNVCFV